jgi:hypothetical protein
MAVIYKKNQILILEIRLNSNKFVIKTQRRNGIGCF